MAEDGRELVDVEYEPLPAVLDPERALAADAPLLDDELGTNNIAHIEQSAGDVDGAFAEADHVFTKRFVARALDGRPDRGPRRDRRVRRARRRAA